MIRFFSFFTILLGAGITSSSAQSPYYFDWKKEGVIASIGLSTWGTSYLVGNTVDPFSLNKVNSFNRASVNDFDRVATFNNSMAAAKTSDYLSLGSKFLPVLFLADQRTRNHFHDIAFLYAETYLVANGLTTLTKRLVARPRPFVFNENVDDEHKLDRGARYSFFSGHTSKTAAMSFFTAKVYADFYPASKWRPFVWTVAATIPAVTGYMRVQGGKHYPSDVIVGYAVGAATGILVPHLHRRIKKKGKGEKWRLTMGAGSANVRLVF